MDREEKNIEDFKSDKNANFSKLIEEIKSDFQQYKEWMAEKKEKGAETAQQASSTPSFPMC